MTQHPILLNGEWCQAKAESFFQPFNPTSGQLIAEQYPVSNWDDCDLALQAAADAFAQLRSMSPLKVRHSIANFLEFYAAEIEKNSDALVDMAHAETGLAKAPRLADGELPRTCNQLRQAAIAARSANWTMPTIDSTNNIRSMLQSIGPVAVFGPNNFPFAFGSISGGDFAAAIAAGNPVIAKAHPSHPGTTRLFAELALKALIKAELPSAMVQLIYAMSNGSGIRLVADPRIAATGFTGSRTAGLTLKQAAEQAGKLIYLELSSINPVVVLAGAIEQAGDKIVEDFANSCLQAAGQLCTKPGLLIVPIGNSGDSLVEKIAHQFNQGIVATLLSPNAADHILNISSDLIAAGAELLTKQTKDNSGRFCNANTLMSVTGQCFICNEETFQQEMFGNASLIIRSANVEQTCQIIRQLEGNLTGCIYSHTDGLDDADYALIEPELRQKVGRLINDKMPTGVMISPAINHGGPFPASGHPGFSAVGLPGSVRRFSGLKCYDGVRETRLPDILQNANPEKVWRSIDGRWSMDSI